MSIHHQCLLVKGVAVTVCCPDTTVLSDVFGCNVKQFDVRLFLETCRVEQLLETSRLCFGSFTVYDRLQHHLWFSLLPKDI